MTRSTLVLIAACALSACATGQFDSKPGAPATAPASTVNPACPDLARWGAPQLYGSWSFELSALGQRGRMQLRQHPDFAASLRGELDYGDGQRSIASGDLEAGEFNLDESRDGKSLYAFWTGNLVPASCGREITGTWEQVPHAGQPALKSPFVLRRVGGDGSRW
ncbi:MAG: hypothetical protein J0I00_17075 [Burkholderiales bacterium]|nr:hypothetical protein [Burkholderiales bacterium]